MIQLKGIFQNLGFLEARHNQLAWSHQLQLVNKLWEYSSSKQFLPWKIRQRRKEKALRCLYLEQNLYPTYANQFVSFLLAFHCTDCPPLIQWGFHTLTQFVSMGVSHENSLSTGQRWEPKYLYGLSLYMVLSLYWVRRTKVALVLLGEQGCGHNNSADVCGWSNSDIHVRVCGPGSIFLIENIIINISNSYHNFLWNN